MISCCCLCGWDCPGRARKATQAWTGTFLKELIGLHVKEQMLKLKLKFKQRMQKVQAYSKSNPIWCLMSFSKFFCACSPPSFCILFTLFHCLPQVSLSTDCQDHSLSLPELAWVQTSPQSCFVRRFTRNCVPQMAGCPASIGDATSRLGYGKEGCGGRGPVGWWWERPEEDLEEVGRTDETLRLMGLSLDNCRF